MDKVERKLRVLYWW